jgi:hypothetical protein
LRLRISHSQPILRGILVNCSFPVAGAQAGPFILESPSANRLIDRTLHSLGPIVVAHVRKVKQVVLDNHVRRQLVAQVGEVAT